MYNYVYIYIYIMNYHDIYIYIYTNVDIQSKALFVSELMRWHPFADVLRLWSKAAAAKSVLVLSCKKSNMLKVRTNNTAQINFGILTQYFRKHFFGIWLKTKNFCFRHTVVFHMFPDSSGSDTVAVAEAGNTSGRLARDVQRCWASPRAQSVSGNLLVERRFQLENIRKSWKIIYKWWTFNWKSSINEGFSMDFSIVTSGTGNLMQFVAARIWIASPI